MNTEVPHCRRGRSAVAAGVLAFLLFAPSSASAATPFISGALDSFAAEGHSDANGSWEWTSGAEEPVLSGEGAARTLSFEMGSGEALSYEPADGSDAGGTADVVVSNVLATVSTEWPSGAVGAYQAAVCALQIGDAATPSWYGWAGATTSGVPVWIELSGATPDPATPVTVTMSFDYVSDPATVTFKIGTTTLENATNSAEKAFALATEKRLVEGVAFMGSGTVGDLAGSSAPGEYAIRFCGEDGALLHETNVVVGTKPVYLWADPSKASTASQTFAFAGWTNATKSVSDPFPDAEASASYFAAFTASPREYTVTWNYKAADGSDTSDTTTVVWEQIPSHADPAGYVANNTMYSFSFWSPAPAACDGTAATTAYTASYTSTVAKATVITVVDGGAETNTAYYATLAAAVGAAPAGATVTLLADDAATRITVEKDLVIDLGGNTFTGRLSMFDGDVVVTNGTVAGRFDVYDSSVVTLAAGATVDGFVIVWGVGVYGESGCKTPTLNVYGTVRNDNTAATSDKYAISTSSDDDSRPVVNIYDGAVVETVWAGVGIRNGASLNMTGGSITAGEFGIYNNGADTMPTTISVSGGTVTSTNRVDTSCGIYQAGPGTLTISGTAVVSGPDAVEVRAGTVQVLDNARLVATMPYVAPSHNTSASSGNSGHGGVGLLLSQHTTARPLSATVDGGTITGEVAFAEVTVETQNDPTVVSGSINGGTLYGSVESEDIETLVPSTSTAVFSDADAEGVAEGYALKETGEGTGLYAVAKTWAVAFTVDGAAYTNLVVFDGEPVAAPVPNPEKTDHSFRAWQTNGVDWVFSTPVAADLTLVADWTQTAFSVTWKNGDTVLETDEHVALDAQPSYGGAEPTQAPVGVTTYTFDGWTGGDVVSPTLEADLPSVTADVVYTAHFAASGKPVMVISVAGTATNYFDTVAQAVSAAGPGETVVLLTDAALSSPVEISKSLTIDLNGNDLAATDCRALWIKSGDVRITGSGTVSADGTGLAGSSSVIRVGDGAANATAAALLIDTNVVVSSATCYGVTVFGKNDADGDADTADISLDLYGTVSVTSSGDADAAIGGNGHASLKPVDIVVHDGATVSSANSAAIYFPGWDTLTVGDATITGLHGIVARAGSVVVNGGSITATGTGAGEALGDSAVVVPYAAVVYDTSANYPWHAAGAVATINGGTIVSAVEPCVVQIAAEGDAAAVLIPAGSAAVFSDADADGVPDGYALKETAEGSGFYSIAKTWAVAFTVDGAAYTNLVVFDGEPVERPADPRKDCYTFRAWQTNGVDWVFTDAVTADLALVADWTRNAVTITAPAVANATASATTNGVAVAGTAGGNGATLFVVEAGTAVVVTYAADAGYHVSGSDPVSTTADVQVAAADTANDLTLAAGLLPTMEPNVYDVVWENWDETPLATNRVVHGTTTNWVGDTPARASTDDFGYVFASWTTNGVDVAPDAVAIVADTVFAARFDAVSLAEAKWIGGAQGDWNVATNWDIGYVPTRATVVTFTNDAQAAIYHGECVCKEMVLDDADVTIVRADQGSGYDGSVDLHFQGNAGSAVSGTGTLGVNTVGLFNNNYNGALSIGTALDIRNNTTFKGNKDKNGHAGSWNVVGKTTIANVSEVLRVSSIDDAVTTFKSNVVIAAGASVEFYAAHGEDSGKHAGEIVVDSASTVTLAHSGNSVTKLVLYPYNGGRITANDGQIVADSTGYYVKKYSQSGNKTVYELHPKRTVVSVTATGVTVEGVETGDRFAPGESFTIEVSGLAEGHDAILRITKHNGGSVVATATNELSYAYTMPDYDIDVSVTAAIQTFAVTWLDWDGAPLETDGSAEYGTVPSYDGAAPSREPTDDTTFWFDGWTNAAVANPTAPAALPRVVADAAYGAHYAESNRLYAIDFRSEDGASSYFSTSLTWHAAVVYEGAEPTKPATPALGFVFAGWTNGVVSDPTSVAQLPAVSGDATYFAAFDATNNLYEVVLVADGAPFYRTNIVYDGFVVYPQRDPVHAEEGRTFMFRGWTNEVVAAPVDPVGPVKEAGTWHAAFEEIDAVAKVVYADGYEELLDTLAAAVARAGDGEKAVLLADASGAGFEIDRAATLDLGGHVYEITSADDPVYVTAEGAVVTNGALVSSVSAALDVAGSATIADLAVTNDWEDCYDGAIYVSGAATLSGVDVLCEYGPAIVLEPGAAYAGESRLDGSNVSARAVWAPTLYALGPVSFADSAFVNDDDEFEMPAVWIEEGGSVRFKDVEVTADTGAAIASSGPVVLDGGSYSATNAPNWNAVALQTPDATLAATNAAVTGTGAYPALHTIAPFDLSGCAVTNLGAGAAISAAGADAVGAIAGTKAVAFDDDALLLDSGAFAAVEDCAFWSEYGSAVGVYAGAGALVESSDEEGGRGSYESASDVAVYAEGAGCLVEIDGGIFYSPEGTNPLKALAGAEIEVSGGWFTAEVPEGCLARGYAASPAWPDAAPDRDAPFTVYIYRDIAWADFTVEPVAFVYDGSDHAPAVRAVFTDDEGETETLHVPGDYAMALPEGRVDADEYTIAIQGTNSWYGTTNLVFAITNRPLSIVALDARKTYGEADPALLFTTNGLVDGDELHGALARAAGEGVGTYAITQGTLHASANYDLSFAGAVFTIDPATVEPPAAPASAVYDGTEKVPGIATSTLWNLSGTNGLVDAGVYDVRAELADKANYTWTDGSTTDLVYRFEIARAEVEPPAEPAGAVYDGEVHCASFAESDLWTVAGNDGWTAAGTHGGIAVSLVDPANYVWSDGTDAARDYTFTIAKATVERPVAPAGTNYVADTVYADIPASGLYAVSGNDGFRNAGSYGIVVSLLDPGNYAWDDGTTNDLAFSFVVAKAPLTATARNVTVDFGDDPDMVVYPIDYVGFLGDDDETNALDPAPAVWAPGYTADAERNTSFDLVFTNLGASANYEIACDATDRKLYVAPTPVTLTFDPVGGTDVDLSSMNGLEGVTNAGVNILVANVGTALDAGLFATAREGWVFSGWDPEIPAAVPNSGTNYVAQWSAPGAMVISVADAGTGATSTNWCLALRDAVSNAPAGSTVVLLADDRTSFAEGGIAIDKGLTIDGAGFTVYGATDLSVANVGSPAEISSATANGFYIAGGDVTIRNVALTEFGDTAYLNKFGYVPVLTSTDYAGDLVLENVDIDKFNRQAVCVLGGKLTMTGGTIVANAEGKGVGSGSDYFQQPIEVRGGTALIDGVTITGGGSNLPYPSGAIVVWSSATLTNVVVDFTGVGVWTDYGSLAVVGGDTSVAATDKALFVEDGGSIAVAAGDFAGELAVDAVAGSSIVVSGGTFDRQVPAGFVDPDLLPTTVADGSGRFTVKPPRTVSFVAGEGESGLPGALTVAQTDPAAEPEQKPSKDGYVFRAWRLGGADYDWSSPVLEDIALSAAWSPAPYPLVIRYVVPAGAVQPPAYSNDVPYGAKYSVASPAVAGCTPRRRLVSGTMPMGGVEIEVGYIGSLALCSFDVEDAEYDGTPRTPGLVVRDAAGSELVAGRDYSVSVSGAPTDVGEGYGFTVDGLGSWNGSTNLVFAIVPATVEVPSLKDKVYTAAGQSAEIDGASDLYRIVAGPDGTNVAQYVATVALEDALNYRWTGGSADPTNLAWSITPAPLTVTPDALSKAYGAEDPVLTYTAAGLLGDDALSGALVRAEGEERGTYAISQGTLAAGANYAMTFTEGVLFEITRATVVVTAEAATKTYGEADPAFTATVDGLDEGGDTRLAYDVVRTEAGENVGEYAIAPTGDAEQGNYLVTYVASTLTIGPKAATVAAGDASKVAGNADPAFTATVFGLVAGDSTNLVSYSISRAAGEAAGTYAITPSGDAAQGNYAVTFVPGTLTIEAAAASVAHNGATTHFATLGAALAAAADGDAVALEANVAETVTIGASVSLDLAGYTLSGDVTNASASASVSGGAVTGDVVSDGGALEIAGGTFDGTLSGKNGGTIAIAGGSFKDDPTPFVDPATRAVVPNASTGYNDVVVRRSLAGAAVSVAADLVYDGSAQSGVTNVAVDGENLVLGRDYVVVYEANVGATNAAVATVVGTNTWVGAVSATFPIGKATLTATATNVTVAAGTDPAAVPYGVALAGFVNGEDETVLAALPVATNVAYTAATPAGEYAISVSGGAADNYAFEYFAGTLTVVDLTPPAVDVGEGMGQEGDPPAVEVKDGRFYARFRATRTDVSYVLVASENVAASESEWLAAAPVSGEPARPDAVGAIVTLSAPVPADKPALFFKIRASR